MHSKLSQVVPESGSRAYGPVDIDVTGISYDSRKIGKGDIFVALPGKHADGRTFIQDAVRSGAAAVVSGEYVELKGATLVVVKDPLAAMAEISAKLFKHPDRKIFLAGVTGTNGKTTITYFLESIFQNAGIETGVIGTVNYRFADKVLPAPNTTPQSADLYKMLSDMVKSGIKTAVMEVSSHALALGRVAGIEFDLAVYTNLTRDHLDFHKTMEQYFEAKAKLFTGLRDGEKKFEKAAIINIDDPWGRKLSGMVAKARVVTYGLAKDADIRAENIRTTSGETDFDLKSAYGNSKVCLSLLGQHNVYNALASLAVALASGISLRKAVEGLEKIKSVPGRLQKIDMKLPFTVVVDYAHTDDALNNVLKALLELKPARIITVFGCGGERDTAKRPLMGQIAATLSDFVFITSDNPRGEDPGKIALEIEAGVRKIRKKNYEVVLDREQAIAEAVSLAKKGDILLIAGKGHETYQIIGDQRIHFNDSEMAIKYLSKLEK